MPKSDPPVAYITNMFGASVWTATWDAAKKDFNVQQTIDLAPLNGGVPLEIYFNKAGDRFYRGDTPKPYPHGIAIHDGIDRILITETIKHDLTEPGETITVIEASTGKPLNSHKVSNKPSPSGVAPVEILFVPKSDPPVAYITNMFGASLWTATWDAAKKDFNVQQTIDLAPLNGGVPLELYFNKAGDRFYLTTANPGKLHIFDLSGGPLSPKLLKTIDTAGGAHHVAFTKDGRYAFVQNNLLGLDGMNDASITVVDLREEKVIKSLNTFKNRGLNPNLIVLLPEWNDPAGH